MRGQSEIIFYISEGRVKIVLCITIFYSCIHVKVEYKGQMTVFVYNAEYWIKNHWICKNQNKQLQHVSLNETLPELL